MTVIRGTRRWRTLGRLCVIAITWLAKAGGTAGQTPASAPGDDPQAAAAYRGMIAAFRQAQTLSYRVESRWHQDGQPDSHTGFYQVRLQKPNYFRLEASTQGLPSGTLVGDGRDLWIFWSGPRPAFELSGTEDEASRRDTYMTRPAPIGGHSIGHEMAWIGAVPVLDPSIFHGYTDSLQPYLSGHRFVGRETVGTEECEVIEVSFLEGQRVWKLWISRRDHLPRRVHELVRLADSINRQERWLEVKVNEPLSDDRFTWRPPAGWRRWSPPEPDFALLRPGWRAPDFELLCADGQTRRLSEYRERIVWLVFWRYG